MKRIALTAVLSSALTLGVVHWLGAAQEGTRKVVLENPRVRVMERTIPPGGAREPHTRPADQVIVFLDDSTYERIDPETGEKAVRKRKAGDVIWHSKGESAPRLVNVNDKPFRSLVIHLR